MIEGWRPKAESVYLTFGILYHNALELYDRLRASWGKDFDHEIAVKHVVARTLWDSYGDKFYSDSTSRNRHTLIRSIIWYLEEFKDDALKTVTLENGKPAVELSFRMELGWSPERKAHAVDEQPYVLCGHIDRLVNFMDGVYVTDRKTTGSTIGSDYFSRFDLDNQMSGYTVAANVIFHAPVRGVIIDGAQIAVGFTRFARGMTYRTPAQTQEWLGDLKMWLSQFEKYATDGYWPMNLKGCFLCAFKKVCSKDPGVRQLMLESDFDRRPWNPLEVR